VVSISNFVQLSQFRYPTIIAEQSQLLNRFDELESKLDYIVHLLTGNGHRPQAVTELLSVLSNGPPLGGEPEVNAELLHTPKKEYRSVPC
jgi:hypothetical protein